MHSFTEFFQWLPGLTNHESVCFDLWGSSPVITLPPFVRFYFEVCGLRYWMLKFNRSEGTLAWPIRSQYVLTNGEAPQWSTTFVGFRFWGLWAEILDAMAWPISRHFCCQIEMLPSDHILLSCKIWFDLKLPRLRNWLWKLELRLHHCSRPLSGESGHGRPDRSSKFSPSWRIVWIGRESEPTLESRITCRYLFLNLFFNYSKLSLAYCCQVAGC